jgi:hypothetical protein
MSGQGRDCHGDVESTPKISVSTHGLDSEKESTMLSDIHKAILKIIKPKSVTA